MNKFLLFLIALIFLFASLGELVRLPIGPGNGILPNDILVGLTVGLWFFDRLFIKRTLPHNPLILPFVTFSGIAFVTFLNGSTDLSLSETVKSGLYLVRFVEYFMLTFVVFDLAHHKYFQTKILNILFASAFLIAIFGFIQLKIYPDFTRLAMEQGWDPHQNRLLSTWFDPNFVGGMLAFVICLITCKIVYSRHFKTKLPLIILAAILLSALFLTYSRSAYLALIIGVGLIGIFKSKKIIIYGLLALILLLPLSSRTQDRIADLYYSAKSFLVETYELPDPSARLRLDSWGNALTIFKDHPLLGVGYNTYSSAQLSYGFMTDENHHATTGSDSTFLTILATTGIIGVVIYSWLILAILWFSAKNTKNLLSFGFFSGFFGILIHSVFVNSLLYTPLLIFIYTALGIILAPKLHQS